MTKSTQTIEIKLVVTYSTEEGDQINLAAVVGEVEEKIFDALERERGEGSLSPEGLCCDYFKIAGVKVGEAVEG